MYRYVITFVKLAKRRPAPTRAAQGASIAADPMALLFQRTTSVLRDQAAAKLTAHARTVIGADNDTAVSVNGHDCGDPGCGARTIVIVMRSKRPIEAVRIDKPLEQMAFCYLGDARFNMANSYLVVGAKLIRLAQRTRQAPEHRR